MSPAADAFSKPFSELTDQMVVVDTDAPVLYIGRFLGANPAFLTLGDADIHECSTTGSRTKEVYAMEAGRNGVHPSRACVRVLLSRVLSISRLDEVVQY